MKKKPNYRSASAGTLIALILFLAAGRLVATGTLLAFVRPEGTGRVSNRTLTFAERVAYQRAIEEVYWRHRIWPKENPNPKPSLDAVMSQAQLEKKVADYLSKSQALEDYWQRPIPAEELQTEMDRMAQHTKQPEVLRELFEALGNDPFLIAECLARPIVAERLVAGPTVVAGVSSAPRSLSAPATPASTEKRLGTPTNLDNAAYKLPQIAGAANCTDDTWTATTTVNVPDARWGHTAVWTGSEMIVWGGIGTGYLNTGGRYNPATDSWMATSTTNAPIARWLHSAVWTGIEMIVWAGGGGTDFLNTGGKYNPTDDSWTAISTASAPTARVHHTAVWTGSEMIVWGGYNYTTSRFNSGGRYNPAADSWTATSTMNAPEARWAHTVEWTGSEMIVWGGTDETNYLHTGGKYNPSADSWTATGTVNVPLGRVVHTAVWTGSEMIVWGGVDETFNDTNTGGRYNPSTDSWIATNSGTGPSPRDSHSAVWTGSEMIVWGGYRYPPGIDETSGGRYNPANDSWTPTSTANVPFARDSHTAVWTGSEMIVWGGISDSGLLLNTGGGYCAQPSTPIVQSAVSRKTHGFVGDFDIPLLLNGTPGIECRSSDFIGDHTIVVTFLANVSVTGTPQAAVTLGSGTIGSGGVSNGGLVMISGNVVTIPLTNVANAQTINVRLNNVNGSTNLTIPMSVLLGDVNGNGAVNASDVALTKSRSGQPVAAATFRSDVNADGSINAADVALVKSLAGTGLP